MTCAEPLVGRVRRPNSCLAGVFGSSGLASGGSGCGLSVPLSCAGADATTSIRSSAEIAGVRRAIALVLTDSRQKLNERAGSVNAPRGDALALPPVSGRDEARPLTSA